MSRGFRSANCTNFASKAIKSAAKKEKKPRAAQKKKRRRHLKRLGVQPLGASKGWSLSAESEIRKLQIKKL